jgi:hypothetical protein
LLNIIIVIKGGACPIQNQAGQNQNHRSNSIQNEGMQKMKNNMANAVQNLNNTQGRNTMLELNKKDMGDGYHSNKRQRQGDNPDGNHG